MRRSLKNTALATILATTLTACGGGGGGAGSVINSVGSVINNDVITGGTDVATRWSGIVGDFSDMVASSMAYDPTDADKEDAKAILKIIDDTVALWAEVEDIILDSNNFSDKRRIEIYNGDDYKEAVAAIKYLQDVARPIIVKVQNGVTISDSEFDSVAKDTTAQQHINTYKETEATTHAIEKKQFVESKGQKVSGSDTPVQLSDETVIGEPEVTYTEWQYLNGQGGVQERTKTTTKTKTQVTKTKHCEYIDFVYADQTKDRLSETCETRTAETVLDPDVQTETESREGENKVVSTEDVSPEPLVEEEKLDTELTKTVKKVNRTYTETSEGSGTTNTETVKKETRTVIEGNTKKIYYQNYEVTTKTIPITSITYEEVHYTYYWVDKKRSKTTTYNWTKDTYADATYATVKNDDSVAYGNWVTTNSITEETKTEQKGDATIANQVTTEEVPIGNEYFEASSVAYSDADQNLGTPTANLSAVVNDHRTTEYNNSTGLNTINAANAYARGWTGEGAVLGVIDTWQDTDHPELDGKYEWYKDYTRYDSTVSDGGNTQYHGTHVAGIIAGKKDGTGTHGVAYNSTLVGANVDYYGRGGISKNQAQNALHDMAKLKSPTANGGEEKNIIAVNMSFNTPQLFTDRNGSTVTELSDGTYNAQEITDKIFYNGAGDARYWQVATDNDIILVNSAGNAGYNHAGDPGIWAVEENADGSLVLGGKMVIVGNWDGSNVSGNKAGHVCLDINTVNNTCNDTYRISDFYILAPGNNIKSAVPVGLGNTNYMTSSGTSMAAPHVTASFGILHQMWPYMKGENLVSLVMNTADKSLPNYNVNIHGQGLLDLDEATKPQGAVGIPTTGRVDHPVVSLNNTYFSTGTALPSSLQNLQIMVLDDYDRNYYMNIGSNFVVHDKRKVSDIEQMNNGYMWMPINQNYGSFAQGGQWDLGYMNFGLHTGESGNGDYSTNIGKKFFISDRFAIKGNVGQMKENTTWLGNSSDGVLAVGENNITNFAQIGASYQIGNNVLSLDYNQGSTDINTADNSLITGFSDVKTESWRLAYEMHKDENNTLGWSFSLPSHITSGSMDMEVAESVNLDGTINYTNITSDLTQKHKEKNIGFFFNHTPTHDTDASFNFTAEYRQDIAGVNGNDGVELGMNYVKKFWGACKFLWMKNPKCYTKDANGKDVLTAQHQKMMFGHNNNNATKHGLVYDMKKDMFVPINPDDPKWK